MRRVVLIAALLIFLLINQAAIDERRRSITRMRDDIGIGRGLGPRSPQRRFRAIDVYGNTIGQGDKGFRDVTRFSRAQLDDLIRELQPLITRNRRVRAHMHEPSGEPHATKLSLNNRVMLTLRFLVFGSTLADLSNQFGLCVPAVSEELRHGVYAIAQALSYEINWPGPVQRQLLSQITGPLFANAFGTVDGTFTPSVRRRGDFSGHRHAFVRSHQIACDSLGYIVHVIAGQIGSRHDAWNYQRSDLPDLLAACGAHLLADVGYEGELQGLILPATAESMPDRAQRAAFNRLHKSRRSRIEQFIGTLKELFKIVGRRWRRSDERFLSVCVVACCCLYNRWRRLR